MENLTFTVPQDIQSYSICSLDLDWENALIYIHIKDEDGRKLKIKYEGTQATTLMVSLNKANLSTNSLHKRIFQQLVTDGKLPAGTVTGSPD